MTEAKIYVEGGGNSKELQSRCREGFKKLLEASGKFPNRLPRIIACGSRNDAFSDFKAEMSTKKTLYVALLVDSEDSVADTEKPWEHLKKRDDWDCPIGVSDDQVFLMTTCMETWIIADREGLQTFFERHRPCLQKAGLPAAESLETKPRHSIQDSLMTATKHCASPYAKTARSFEALANVDPKVLRLLLPSFARMERILDNKLLPRK